MMPTINSFQATLLFDAKAILGEGPVWDFKKQLLYWVDIENGKLHCHNTMNGENKEWCFGEMLGAAVPTESGKMLLALESGLATYDFEKDTLTRHPVLENGEPRMRYNDGKVDPNGNFWIGSMHKEFVAKSGNLYCVTHDFKSTIEISETTISNGMAWASDQRKFYYIDSPTFEVLVFDFDRVNGSISNRKCAFKIPESNGTPDGMCIDGEDMLWIAHWGGGCVRRWNPNNGEILEEISISAPQVTSCCFGGEHLNTLYITTARSGMTEEQLAEFPLSGGLFQYHPQVKGVSIDYFKDH
ncbi:MAG: SMP-30/gluconolactonase/LRE family protein [Flavobacteriaceae bacterium]